jgi:hypothetical protein
MNTRKEMRRKVVASLEDARVVITEDFCQLDEYDFDTNCWNDKERYPWPLSREQAQRWLQGWNSVDSFKARNLLIRSEPG